MHDQNSNWQCLKHFYVKGEKGFGTVKLYLNPSPYLHTKNIITQTFTQDYDEHEYVQYWQVVLKYQYLTL